MNNIFSENIPWSIGVIVTLFGIIAVHRLILYRAKRNKFSEEAVKFRNKILTELEGIFPVTQFWDETVFSRLRHSIAKVETAAVEFGYFVKRKRKFNAAIKEYCEYCRTITWDKYVQWSLYPSMRKPGDIEPRERFKNIVEHLLSFANDK